MTSGCARRTSWQIDGSQSAHLSVCPSVRLPVCPSVSLSVSESVGRSVGQSGEDRSFLFLSVLLCSNAFFRTQCTENPFGLFDVQPGLVQGFFRIDTEEIEINLSTLRPHRPLDPTSC